MYYFLDVYEPERQAQPLVKPTKNQKAQCNNVSVQFPEDIQNATEPIFMYSYVEEVTHCNIY